MKISTGRGTGTKETIVGPKNWAGDAYRKSQQERLAKIGSDVRLVMGRGNKSISLKDLPVPQRRPSTEGMVRITNRGTGSRKSTNKGSS